MSEARNSLTGTGEQINQVTHSLIKKAEQISRVLHIIGGAMLAAMMFLTFIDVVLRYVFNKPILGSFDLTEYMMVILVAFGFAYCETQKGHVIVEVILYRLPKRAQRTMGSISLLVSLAFFSVITWRTFLYFLEMLNSKLMSSVLPIPIYPFAAVVVVGSAAFSLVLLLEFVDSLYGGTSK
jgi:TRAP-type transport system small permease protein